MSFQAKTKYQSISPRLLKQGLLLSTGLAVALPLAAQAQSVPPGCTTISADESATGTGSVRTVGGEDCLFIADGVTLTSEQGAVIAQTSEASNGGIEIYNAGTLQATVPGGGSRGFNSAGNRNVRDISIFNFSTGTISATAEAITVWSSDATTDVGTSLITIENSGLIESTSQSTDGSGPRGRPAIRIYNLVGGSVNITNNAGGTITGSTGIESQLDATIVNAGDIIAIGGGNDFWSGTALALSQNGNDPQSPVHTVTLLDGSNTLAVDNTANAIFINTGNAGTVTINDGANVVGNIRMQGGGVYTVNIGTTAIIDGVISAGDTNGDDTINLIGAGSANVAEYLNFENLGVQSGTWTVAGSDSITYSGGTTVTGGSLLVDGTLTSDAAVSGGVLGGSGTLAGDVTVTTGTIAPGNGGIGTLSTGSLSLTADSILDFDFGAPGDATTPGASDRIDVTGDLVLDGTLNATDVGGFGDGVYRLIDYSGTLTDNGLFVGVLPSGFEAEVQTAVGNQVNLIVAEEVVGDPTIQFWDGSNTSANNAIDGGAGTWDNSTTNWTTFDGAANSSWNELFAVFQATGGVVTVSEDVALTGLQIASTGYDITSGGGSLVISLGDSNFRVDPGLTGTISANITGDGGLLKNDIGTLVLSGTNTYAGDTAIAFGTLEVLGGAALPDTTTVSIDAGATLLVSASEEIGSLIGEGNIDLATGGVLTVGGTDSDATFEGGISGSGGLTKTGSGTLTLTGPTSFGSTTVAEGTLAGNAGSGQLTVASGATFDLAGGDETVSDISGSGNILLGANTLTTGSTLGNTTFSGDISGTGDLIKVGSGTLTLQGTQTFTGTTTVNNGLLLVNGTLASAASSAGSGTLGGTGTIGELTVDATLAPGSGGIGTLNVNGPATFNAGSIFEVEIDPDGSGDLLAASGAVTINGGDVQVIGNGTDYANLQMYTIVTGSSVTGTFDGVTDNLAFLDTSLSYTANSVILNALRNDISFAAAGITPNQIAVGEALDGAQASPLGAAVINLSLSEAQTAFASLSGEIYAAMLGSRHLSAWEDRRPIIARNFAGEDGLTFWADGSYVDRDVDGEGGYAGYSGDRMGGMAGVEYRAGGRFAAGASVSYGQEDLSLDSALGSADIDTLGVFVYGRISDGPISMLLGGGYSWSEASVARDAAAGTTLAESVSGDEDGTMIQLFGDLSYSIPAGGVNVAPFVGLAFVENGFDGVVESGGAAALTVEKDSIASIAGSLGLRFDGPVFGDGLLLDSEIAVDYYIVEPDMPMRVMSLANVPGTFRVGSGELDRTVFRGSLGLAVPLAGGQVGFGVNGRMGDNVTDLGGNVSVSFGF